MGFMFEKSSTNIEQFEQSYHCLIEYIGLHKSTKIIKSKKKFRKYNVM